MLMAEGEKVKHLVIAPRAEGPDLTSGREVEIFDSYSQEIMAALTEQRKQRQEQGVLSQQAEERLASLIQSIFVACRPTEGAIHSFFKDRVPRRFLKQEFWPAVDQAGIHFRIIPRFTSTGENLDASEPFWTRNARTITLPAAMNSSMRLIPVESPIVITFETWNPIKKTWDIVSAVGCLPDSNTFRIDEVQGTPDPPESSLYAKLVSRYFRPSTAIPLFFVTTTARQNDFTSLAVRKHEHTTFARRGDTPQLGPNTSPYKVVGQHTKEFGVQRLATPDSDEYTRFAL